MFQGNGKAMHQQRDKIEIKLNKHICLKFFNIVSRIVVGIFPYSSNFSNLLTGCIVVPCKTWGNRRDMSR